MCTCAVCVHVCMCTCACVRVHVCVHVCCVHVYVCMCTCACVCVCMCVRMCTCACVCVCVHVYVHVCALCVQVCCISVSIDPLLQWYHSQQFYLGLADLQSCAEGTWRTDKDSDNSVCPHQWESARLPEGGKWSLRKTLVVVTCLCG